VRDCRRTRPSAGIRQRATAVESEEHCQRFPRSSPSPGTPEEGWGEGNVVLRACVFVMTQKALTLTVSRSTGKAEKGQAIVTDSGFLTLN
jgi:hypothetical protein